MEFAKQRLGSSSARLAVHAANLRHRLFLGRQGNVVNWTARLEVDSVELDYALKHGWDRWGIEGWIADRVAPGTVLMHPNPNLVVNSGVNRSLDRLFAISGPPGALLTVGVDDGASNPVAGTTSSTAGSTNRRLVAFDSTPTRSSQTVDAAGTFTQANVAFPIKRLFLSAATAGTTDSAGDLYAMTDVFTHDNSPFSTWSETFTTQVTGSGS